ncbi:MAG: carboxylesterase family protein [Desulfarculales bacterium]|nr:carboxylesterase family protein [Desulfarculales bacterium]
MPKRKFILRILLSALALILLAETSPAAETVTLTLRDGLIKGLREKGVDIYRGIPYARPPLGELRFAPPQEAKPWEGELDCTSFGKQCFQAPSSFSPGAVSEDCLSLNVWTPAPGGDNTGLPVYVFIHGGGFAAGSGALGIYDGSSFARQGVVTVTINYRLGALGFFASQETRQRHDTTGNWGIMDQILALQWVRDNISAFGGDPAKVTVGGESAGSFSVSALMLSPLAQGLFRGVIMESGAILSLPALSYYARSDLARAAEVSAMLANVFGAADNSEGLAKMQTADASVLASFSAFIPEQTMNPAFFLTPVFDGKVIPAQPLLTLEAADFPAVNLLLGFNHDEGSIFVPKAVDEGQYKMLVMRMLGGDKGLRFLERFGKNESVSVWQRACQAVAYGVFSAGMKRFADLAAKAGGKVYMYQFNYVSLNNQVTEIGASHGAELPLVFNNLENSDLYTPEAQRLAAEMHTRWANFIKTGDPNTGASLPSRVKWRRYEAQNPRLLLLDAEITSGTLPDRENIDYTADLIFGGRN